MSDPSELIEAIDAAADAFGHADGRPEFEAGLNALPDASPGEVQIQKACRLLGLARDGAVTDYFGAILEQSFIAVEHTLQGYLITVSGVDPRELRDHSKPFEYAKGQVPLEDSTIDAIQWLYEERRTGHYYGTIVTTRTQARRMREVATMVHRHVVSFDARLEDYCHCSN